MIKHHPSDELLNVFIDGDLPVSLSAAIAVHADMCPCCQEKIAHITQSKASASFGTDINNVAAVNLENISDDNDLAMFDNMIASIVANDDIAHTQLSADKTITMGNATFTLPKAIANIDLSSQIQFGKLTRARLQLDEGVIHSSLFHIQAGGSIPQHTHKGYELTLLLSGEFSDEAGHYMPGDFIMLDASHTHEPVSEHGCLCFTVVNNALHFTQGINRLLNPIGQFIY